MNFDQVFEKLHTKFSEAVERVDSKPDPFVKADPRRIHEIIAFLRDELGFETLACVSGVDYPLIPAYCVVYHPASYQHQMIITVKAFLPRAEGVSVRTISDLYKAADWFERETYDLFGIRFDQHPDLRRILLPDDWVGHPMRKDYVTPDHYNGLPIPLVFEDQTAAQDSSTTSLASPQEETP